MLQAQAVFYPRADIGDVDFDAAIYSSFGRQVSMGKTRAIYLLFTSLLLLLFPTAYAVEPTPASGTFQVVGATVTSVQPVDNICIIELDATFAFLGTLGGSFTASFKIIHRGSCAQPAPEIFEAQGTYTGSVTAASGTFDFNFEGSIDAQGNAEGKLVILRGTGGLANLHGMLTLTGQAGVGGTYSGQIHFDP